MGRWLLENITEWTEVIVLCRIPYASSPHVIELIRFHFRPQQMSTQHRSHRYSATMAIWLGGQFCKFCQRARFSRDFFVKLWKQTFAKMGYVIQPCYVVLYDIMMKQGKDKCDKNNESNNNNENVDLTQRGDVERFPLRPCCRCLMRLREDVGTFSSMNKEQQLVDKFNLKSCVVVLNDVNRGSIDATPLLIGEEIPVNGNNDRGESVQSISSRAESSHVIINDRQMKNGVIRVDRDNFSMSHPQFAVDDFMCTAKAKHNFLTRFHPTQYTGLTETFDRYIYVSKITGNWFYMPMDIDVTSDVLGPFWLCSLFGAENHQSSWIIHTYFESRCDCNHQWRSDYGNQCAKVRLY